MARGKTEIQFGTSGAVNASVTVTVPGISAADVPQAWVMYRATTMSGAAHSADEHLVEAPLVFAGEPSATGFTIYAVTRNGQPLKGNWSIGWSI